jgi:hypothetical protein
MSATNRQAFVPLVLPAVQHQTPVQSVEKSYVARINGISFHPICSAFNALPPVRLVLVLFTLARHESLNEQLFLTSEDSQLIRTHLIGSNLFN